jgi:hypothetical protein
MAQGPERSGPFRLSAPHPVEIALSMTGILVHGDNHFIVRGPLPSRETALDLVRHWSIIQIGGRPRPDLDEWRIVSREFRENLQWAIVVRGERETGPAVSILLKELVDRGVVIRDSDTEFW